jgi:hypothetical protein
VVRNGVAVIVACGKKRSHQGMYEAMDYVPEPRTGGWWPERRGSCTVWYHRPPGLEQRVNRQERAAQEDYSPECVEVEFSEVQGSNLPRSAPPRYVWGRGRAYF